jgi:hypothetical protein
MAHKQLGFILLGVRPSSLLAFCPVDIEVATSSLSLHTVNVWTTLESIKYTNNRYGV